MVDYFVIKIWILAQPYKLIKNFVVTFFFKVDLYGTINGMCFTTWFRYSHEKLCCYGNTRHSRHQFKLKSGDNFIANNI